MFLPRKHHIPTRRIVYGVHKRHIATRKVIFGVASDRFHWVAIEEGAYKVDMHGMMLLEQICCFQILKILLLLKDVKGQVYSHSRKVWICEKIFEFLFLRLIVVNNGATQNAMKFLYTYVMFVSLSIFSFPISLLYLCCSNSINWRFSLRESIWII